MTGRLLLTAVFVFTAFLSAACAGNEANETPTTNVGQGTQDTAALATIALPENLPPTNSPTPSPPTLLIDGGESATKGDVEIVVQPPVTATWTPQPVCTYAYSLLESTTLPSLVVESGSSFLQTWRIRNDSNCAWGAGAFWVFASGAQMGGPDLVALPAASPGQIVDVTVALTASATPGTFTGLWQPQMADGTRVDPASAVTISVIPPQPTATAVVPTAAPPPILTGWYGEYFNNLTLSGDPVFVRDDPEINFNWGTNSPGEGLQNGNFSARWRRRIQVPGGTYRFFARSEDGVRVWVNGQIVFDEWHDGQNATYQSEVTLRAGEELDVQVEYYHNTGLANVHVWAEPQAEFPNWRGSYINDPNLMGQPVLIRNDQEINFDWGLDAPASGVRADNFSVVWIQSLNFARATYQFNAIVDDGMRLMVDDVMVIDEWRDGTRREVSGIIGLAPGFHDITVTYYDRRAEAEIRVWWEIIDDGVSP